MDGSTTLLELVEEGLRVNTTGVAAATKRDGIWLKTSIADFQEQVRHAAMGLYSLGVRRGDKVVLHSENCAEWNIIDHAVLSLGAVVVPIYTTQPASQIQYIVTNAGASVYIVSTEALFDNVESFRDLLPGVTWIGLRSAFRPNMESFVDLLARGAEQDASDPGLFGKLRSTVQPDDLATLIYTSGTTGQPKGVMLTHRNIVANVQGSMPRMRKVFHPDTYRGKSILSYLPLSHIFERMLTYLYFHIGYPVYYVEDYNEMLADLQSVQPVHFATVPRLLEKVMMGIKTKAAGERGARGALLQWALGMADAYQPDAKPAGWDLLQRKLADRLVYERIRSVFGPNLVAITSGGAALPPQVMAFFNGLGILVGQGYGMTEASPVITVYEPDHLKLGSSGRPLENVEVRIAEDGEILARGPNVMQGYYNLTEATGEVLESDGWYHTGDIGFLDSDEHLYITDRKKALFKLSTGKYVAPQPIEGKLSSSRYVEQAVVVGNQHKFCAALIVPNMEAIRPLHKQARDDASILAHPKTLACIQEAIDAANADAPHWEQVKAFRFVTIPFTIEGGELTPKMSIKRRVVHEKYADLIASMYKDAVQI